MHVQLKDKLIKLFEVWHVDTTEQVSSTAARISYLFLQAEDGLLLLRF